MGHFFMLILCNLVVFTISYTNTFILPVTPQATMQDDRLKAILNFCKVPRSREEIQKYTDIKNRDYFRKDILNPLIEQGLLKLTIPDKPKSHKQKYMSSKERMKNC